MKAVSSLRVSGRSKILVAGFLALSLLAGEVLSAQTVVTASQICKTCEARISPTSVEISTIAPVDVARDGSGRYWTVRGDLGVVEVIGPGPRDRRQVGRRGEGPGEFLTPTTLIPQGDSMWVPDARNARLTLVGPDLSVIRSVPFPVGVFDGVAVSDSILMVNAVLATPSAAGHPLHLVDTRSGDIVKSFGTPDAGEGKALGFARLLASVTKNPTGTGVLVAYRAVPVVQEWDWRGGLLREWKIDAPWLTSHRGAQLGTPTSRPNPVTALILPIGTRELGLGIWVVRDDWQNAWKEVPPGVSELASAEVPPSEALWRGAWVELDLATGEVTHSAWLPFLPRYSVGGMVMQFEDTIDPKLRLWSRLLGSERAPHGG